MKNREKFAKEILDIACGGGAFAVTKSSKITSCNQISCEKCIFRSEKTCRIKRYEWSQSEYVEKHTITLREKKFLDILSPEYKYITKDKNNELYVHDKNWVSNDRDHNISTNIFGNMFDFIKWEDEDPWLIEDLKKLEMKDE